MDTLKKIGLAWLALIIVLIVVIIFYFTKLNRCYAIDFVCDSVVLDDSQATIHLRNHLYDVEIVNLSTASCRLSNWFIDDAYKRTNWDINKEIKLDVFCYDSFDALDLSLVYRVSATNETHNDIISVKR